MYKGRELLVEVDTGSGYVTIGKLRSKRLSLTCEAVEVTDVDSDDWRTLDNQGLGTRSFSFSGSGVMFDAESTVEFMQDAAMGRSLVNMRITFGTGRSYQGNFKVVTFEVGGEATDAISYSLSAESAASISVSGDFFCPTSSICTPSAGWPATTGVSTGQVAYDTMWNGVEFIIVGENGAIWNSGTGATIALLTTVTGVPDLTGIDYSGALYGVSSLGGGLGGVYTGSYLTALTSRTLSGANWTQNNANVGVRKIRYFAGLGWVAVGAVYSGSRHYPAIAHSVDGVTFTTVYTRVVAGDSGTIFDVTWDGVTISAVGSINDPSTENMRTFRVHSTDATSWTYQDLSGSIPSLHALRAIDYNCHTGVYIVCGNESRLFRTTDFTTITQLDLGAGSPDFYSVYYSDYYDRWLVGNAGGTIFWSVDDGLTFPYSHTVDDPLTTFEAITDDRGALPNRTYFAVGYEDSVVSGSNFAFMNNCL